MKINLKKFIVCVIPILFISLLIFIKNFYGNLVKDKFLPCLFNVVTGYQCAGCGGTRSFFALINGDIVSSFKYNAFVPCMLIFFIIAYVRLLLKIVFEKNIRVFPKNDNWIFIPLIVFLMYFIVRNFI